MADRYVYVICHKRNDEPVAPVKIGISVDVQKRLASLQTGNPYPLVIAAQFFCPNGLAETVERSFLEIESRVEHRLAGEWFNYEPIAAVQLVNFTIRALLRFSGLSEDEVVELQDLIGLANTGAHLQPAAACH
jgi:hypothetical protein